MDQYCMAARALKPSLRSELLLKSCTQQASFEDFFNSNANNGVVSGDDFSVDCFLDFSNGEDFKDGYNIQELEVEEEEYEEEDSLFVSYQDNNSNISSTFSDNNSFLTTEFSLPVDELAELEWVSQFVDDSSSPEFSLLYPLKTENHATNRVQPEPKPVFTKISCLFPARIPAKARSKRPRPTTRTWSVGSPITTTDSSSSSCSSFSSPTSGSPPCLVLTNKAQTIDSLPNFSEPPIKKPKKIQTGEAMGSAQFQRRCTHCQVQKTPQWRTGPLGAKTLCNACGVRFKSGRLFPEYRPACSPSFSVDIHSNSHRKVLEIRKKKEKVGLESGLNQMVSSF